MEGCLMKLNQLDWAWKQNLPVNMIKTNKINFKKKPFKNADWLVVKVNLVAKQMAN